LSYRSNSQKGISFSPTFARAKITGGLPSRIGKAHLVGVGVHLDPKPSAEERNIPQQNHGRNPGKSGYRYFLSALVEGEEERRRSVG